MQRKSNNSNLETTEYQFSGKGVKRVVQESVKTRMNVAFVYDKDIHGRPVRVGYCFTSRDTGRQMGPIKWFGKDEIDIFSRKVGGKRPDTGRLDIKFSHPKKNEKHFNITVPLGSKEILFRLIFRIERDGTNNFAILVQSKNSLKGVGEWKTLSRYDCSHGFIHKDLLNKSGRRVRKKKRLLIQDKEKAIGLIVAELLGDLREQEGQRIPSQDIESDFRNAENSLLKLFGSTGVFERIGSTSVIYTEELKSLD